MSSSESICLAGSQLEKRDKSLKCHKRTKALRLERICILGWLEYFSM